MLLNTQLAN